ncbi:MAG: glycerol kinase GlpK [Rhodospirillales bacterium]|nr:glycerol kinase GlpK [Rhodospirillales bacterium]
MAGQILALDQGTTSTRAILFAPPALNALAEARHELPQIYPAPGQVEHDPETIWRDSLGVLSEVLAGARAAEIAGIGITNQRETTLLWDRETGKPIHNAIVWQDRRTAEMCRRLAAEEPMIAARTGLLLDPYFSGTKIAWLLAHVDGAQAAAESGRLAFGTIDSFLLFRLTGGAVHATDATNASRTLLYDLRRGTWDEELLRLFCVPRAVLPEIRDSAADFGTTTLFGGKIRVGGIAGDQQAATLGQACVAPGMAKATYGTGAFLLLVTGEAPVASKNRLLSTVAWQLAGTRTYALEGAIFNAGTAVQWLRDGLGVISAAPEAGRLAAEAPADSGVHLVPAFTGLGAPWWDPTARGALFGLTRSTGPAALARAALESVGFQTADLLAAMTADLGRPRETVLRVDGGMAASDWAMQFLADITGAPVDRPAITETTARGAAYLAALSAGLCPEPARFAGTWQRERRFTPAMPKAERARRLAGWQDAVRRTLTAPPTRTPAASRAD